MKQGVSVMHLVISGRLGMSSASPVYMYICAPRMKLHVNTKRSSVELKYV